MLFLLACAEPEPEAHCPTFADAIPAPTVVETADDCGTWTLPVGDHLVVNVYISEPEVPCTDEIGAGLERPHEPSYTNMSNDAPKWTYDFVGAEAADGVELAIVCDEGTEWQARVDVVE